MLEHIADTSSEDFQHGQPVRRPKIPRYKSKQEAQDVETSRVLANVDLGEKPRGTQGTKTAVSTKVQFQMKKVIYKHINLQVLHKLQQVKRNS